MLCNLVSFPLLVDKAREPSIPNFFLLVVEVLSRGLYFLLEGSTLENYSLPRGAVRVSHLCFADDLAIFTMASRVWMTKGTRDGVGNLGQLCPILSRKMGWVVDTVMPVDVWTLVLNSSSSFLEDILSICFTQTAPEFLRMLAVFVILGLRWLRNAILYNGSPVSIAWVRRMIIDLFHTATALFPLKLCPKFASVLQGSPSFIIRFLVDGRG